MDPSRISKPGHEDISVPKQHSILELNKPFRFSLTGEKLKEADAIPVRKGRKYDPVDFMDSSFDIPRPERRRTINRDEILNSQAENDASSVQNMGRKRPALDNDHLEESRPLDINIQRSDLTSPSSKVSETLFLKEKISLLESHLENLVVQYEELKNIRSTEQEKALTNHLEWAQVKDDAYITLRDQTEEIFSQSNKLQMHNNTTKNINNDNAKKNETEELKAKVASLERQLEERNDRTHSRNRRIPAENSSRLINDLYEDLTGVIVTDVKNGDNTNTYKCLIAGTRGALQFYLTVSKEQNGDVVYAPVLNQETDSELISALPEFLKECVEFEKSNLPTVFTRLSSIMN